jgi:glycosidase
MRNIYYLLMICSLFTACGKSKQPVVPPVVNTTVIQYGTPFTGVPDVKDVIMYEVNFGAFSQQQNIAGVTARLDSLKALGINVIWLMPTYPIGVLKSIGSPYCVMDYLKVNPNYGTLTDLRALVSTAHAKGMSVILDWVANHTSWDNPWIAAHKDWYQQDQSGNIISPPNTNYTDVAALNYNSQAMRQGMISAMKYWVLAANIDGYRCDFADNIPDDFWSQAIDTLKTLNHKLVLLAEGGKTSHFSAGFQMIYGWNYFTALESVFGAAQAPVSTLNGIDQADKTSVPSGDFMLRFTSNHDEESDGNDALTVFNGKAGSIAAFVLAAYEDGVPLVYDGQEVGAPKTDFGSTTIPIDWTTNPDMLAAYKKILAFRNSSDAIKTGTVTQYSDANVAAFEKILGAEDVVVLVNTRNSVINYTLPAQLANTAWKDAMNNGAVVNLTTTLTLQPYGYVVLLN